MHVFRIGSVGEAEHAESRPIVMLASDRSFRLEVERHRVPRLWDAATYAEADRDELQQRIPELVELTRVTSMDRWWNSAVVEEAVIRDGGHALVLHCAQAGLAHRVIAVPRAGVWTDRARSISMMCRLAQHLPEGGLDPELQSNGTLDATLWMGRGEHHIQTDDATPDILRELLRGLLAARVGSPSRITWLDTDVVAWSMELRPMGHEVELRVHMKRGWYPDSSPVEVFAGRCTWGGLAAGVASGLQRLLEHEDAASYRADWVRGWFPVAELEELAAAVEADPPPLCLDLPQDWTAEQVS